MQHSNYQTVRELTGKLVRLASQINLAVYYAKDQELDDRQLCSRLRELRILSSMIEDNLFPNNSPKQNGHT